MRRYRLSSQQNIHRCNSVWKEVKVCEGTTVFYFLQLPTIYGMIPRLIYSTFIPNHSCPGAILGKARVFLQPLADIIRDSDLNVGEDTVGGAFGEKASMHTLLVRSHF
jgi:hypothetical protein